METVIIYAYYETDASIFNLEYFVNSGVIEDSKYLYIFVINGEKCSIQIPEYKNVIVLKRPNIGYDFGAHNYALQWLTTKYGNNFPFEYYVFLNCSVVGPFLPSYYPKNIHWSKIFTERITDKIKLIGTIIGCLGEYHKEFAGPKVGGYFFVTDNIGLKLMIDRMDIFMDHETKISAIAAEYKVTIAIMNAGYNIDCLLYKYQGINWRDPNYIKYYYEVYPDRLNTYFGISIHPFEVVFHKWKWSDQPNKLVNFDYCAKYSEWTLPKNKINLIGNPFYPVILFERDEIESLANFNIYYSSDRGLCNQIFSLISGIIKCKLENKAYIVIDAFSCCIEKGNILEISKIIDLCETTNKINIIDNYENIILFDRSDINLEIINGSYGSPVKYIDVTDQLINYSAVENPLPLNKNMNEFFGNDPCKFVKKLLRLQYKLNGYMMNQTISENEDIFTNINYITKYLYNGKKCDFKWYNYYNEEVFNKILQSITFDNKFYKIIDIIKSKYNFNNINFIHFRVEYDAINHWSKQNKMTIEEFEHKLIEKYTYLLEKYTNKNDINYILSYDEKSIISKLGNKYKFVYTPKEEKDNLLMQYFGANGREMSAIIDLLLGINCSKLFIGCHNFKNKRGSSFSYILAKMSECKQVLIDLDNINNDEEVYG